MFNPRNGSLYFNNPNQEKFIHNYIPFIEYKESELINRDNHKNTNFVKDPYPYIGITPEGWIDKQIGMDKTLKPEFSDAFYPKYNREACQRLQTAKEQECGYAQGKKPNACTKSDSLEVLRQSMIIT